MPLDRMDHLSDDALLAAYAAGDQAAARTLTLRLTPRVFAHAMRLLGDRAEAEDVTQDALMRLWKVAPNWQAGSAKPSTWLFTVTANLCTDRLRRKGRQGVDIDAIPEPEDDAPRAEHVLQEQARIAALESALQSLPDGQRQAVVLRHIEGLGNPEIAEIMDISVRAVESLTARGKRALAAALAEKREALGYDHDG